MKRKLFFIFSSALLILLGISLWREYNPEWKNYQAAFNRLEYEKVKAQYEEAKAEFETPEVNRRYQETKAKYERALAELQKPEVKTLLEKSRDDLHGAEEDLEEAQDKFQETQADLQRVEIAYSLSEDEKKKEELKGRIRALGKEMERLRGEVERLRIRKEEVEAKTAQFTAGRDSLRAKVARFTAEIERLERRLREIRNRKPEIKQIAVKDLGAVDRCTTCHLGIDRADFSDAGLPYRSHPDFARLFSQHPIEKFGCTTCHRGQGRATMVREAHGDERGWPEPMLPGDYVQASCGKCHPVVPKDPDAPIFSSAPLLSAGRKLFEESGCTGCHQTQGYDEEEKAGPDLSQVGDKVKADWLMRWLKSPKTYLPRTKMPDFLLSDEEARDMRDYLMGLNSGGAKDVTDVDGTGDYDRGRILFRESRCISCHAVDGRGGTLGPDLGKVAGKVSLRWLTSWIKDPQSHQPNTKMPRYRFSDDDIKDIVEYMMTDFVDFDVSGTGDSKEGSPERGKRLVETYGCLGCHRIKGMEKSGKVGAELTSFGSKSLEMLDFGLTRGVEHTRIGWVSAKLKNPRVFRDNLKMPDYAFSDEQVKALTVFLLGLTEKKITPEYVTEEPQSDYEPVGTFGRLVDDLKCFTCHTIKGRGGKMATDLTIEGSQVQADWLFKYLKLPYAVRPMLTERMPRFKLTDAEAKALADHIKENLLDDDISEETSGDEGIASPETVERGKRLYEKYGCQACHMVGMKGGYVGPSLNGVGGRLTFGWMFRWLKNPQAFKPETIEPNFHLSDEEARALAAYLKSLK